ncbi:hypothetical protein QQP08_021857 [Theobroma cacao]|nr:hypothetical protein QQP08_021857 [Theobroma cacao]
MAHLVREKPGLIDRSNVMEEIEVPEIDAALLMSLLEESHCEEYCNEEQVNSLMESLEAEIRMANHDSCYEVDMKSNDGFDCFEWTEMEMVPSSPSDDMNWYMEDHVEEMDGMVEFGNGFPHNYYEIPLEHGYSSLWQETYDTAIYN